MNNYNRQYTFAPKYTKTKKIVVVLCIVLILFFVLVTVIGLIADSDNQENTNIKNAVAENTQLKYIIDEQNAQIAELSAQVEELKTKLQNGGVVQNEEPYTPDSEQTTDETPQSYSNNPTTPRDELNN